jgi:hypothetical protein
VRRLPFDCYLFSFFPPYFSIRRRIAILHSTIFGWTKGVFSKIALGSETLYMNPDGDFADTENFLIVTRGLIKGRQTG